MWFNSFAFLVLLSVCLAAFHLGPRRVAWRVGVLLSASVIFYAAWNPPWILLLLLTAFTDWFAGRAIAATETPATRKLWVVGSVGLNLAVLFVFKYGGFAARVVGGGALDQPRAWLDTLILPAGISFYTFQSMSYTLDVYARRLPAEPAFHRFLLFVLFFPQLVAGPIERASTLLGQLRDATTARVPDERVRRGLALILWGFVQKCVFADNLALFVDATFGRTELFPGAWQALATLAFGFQIFFDFAGYSEIARGTAALFGVELMRNFERPYLAASPSDFWRRWHISLSTWFRDYLYIPLGGDRAGKVRTATNLIITMALAGLWHGANWTFVWWGLYHGLLLALWRLVGAWSWGATLPPSFRAALGRGATFLSVMAGWVLFRAADPGEATRVYSAIAGSLLVPMPPGAPAAVGLACVLVAMAWAVARWLEAGGPRHALAIHTRAGLVAGALFLLLVGTPDVGPQFLYFQF